MKHKLAFRLLDGAVWLFSLTPMPLLHILSNLSCWLIRDVFRYRHKIVTENLQKSFPEASEKQIRKYRKQFYLNLTDILAETIKTRTASVRFLQNHCKVTNLELLDHVNGKDFILVCGHRGNWEWIGVGFDTLVEHLTFTVYKPLSNGLFDELMKRMRERHGTIMVPMSTILREMRKTHDRPSMYVFLSDQSPPRTEIQRSVTFLNQSTPVYLGPEKLANLFNLPVLYLDGSRVGRGRYESKLSIVTLDPSQEAEQYVTDKFHELLENSIRKQPDNWLWSHRRWKYAVSTTD